MEIGDKVKVTDFGEVYSIYDDMFEKLNFKDKNFNGFEDDNGEKRYKRVTFTVFGKTQHEDDSRILLVAIKAPDGFELLVGSKGLKEIKDAKI